KHYHEDSFPLHGPYLSDPPTATDDCLGPNCVILVRFFFTEHHFCSLTDVGPPSN
ncbi:hypothetical protein NDU88_004834, partial [Pleurodeles waltl]